MVIMSQAEAEEILDTYKRMSNECSMIMNKISELNIERDEHRLAMDTLQALEKERKAFRLVWLARYPCLHSYLANQVNGVLTERTVGEVLPLVTQNFEGVFCTSELD